MLTFIIFFFKESLINLLPWQTRCFADLALSYYSNHCFPLQELSSQLESQGKVDPASFQALVATMAQQNLASAEKPDIEQYQSRLKAWEAEKRLLIQREKEQREKAEQEKRERLAAQAAAQA